MRRTVILILLVTTICLTAPAIAGWEEGVAAFRSKDYQQAVAEFQQVVRQNPDGWSGHYMLGLSLDQLERKEEALQHLRMAYDLNPNDLSVKVALGRAYFDVRRYGEVSKLLGSVDGSSLPSAQRAAFYRIRGQAKAKSGDEAGALEDFSSLAKLQPDDAETQYIYGAMAMSAGQIDEAIDALARAAQLAPQDANIKRAQAQALLHQGRTSRDQAAKRAAYTEAAQVAKSLVAGDPSYDNQVLEISAELGAGLYSEAVETARAAIAKRPEEWLAHYYLGQAYTGNQQYAEAEGPLIQAMTLASSPDDQQLVWRQLGFAYEKQNKFAQSIDAYQNAGDPAGVARVQENQKTAAENAQIDAENAAIEAMRKEAEELEKQLKELEDGGGGQG